VRATSTVLEKSNSSKKISLYSGNGFLGFVFVSSQIGDHP
jgi:hypothetical protein